MKCNPTHDRLWGNCHHCLVKICRTCEPVGICCQYCQVAICLRCFDLMKIEQFEFDEFDDGIGLMETYIDELERTVRCCRRCFHDRFVVDQSTGKIHRQYMNQFFDRKIDSHTFYGSPTKKHY